jgi:hypothetical protein
MRRGVDDSAIESLAEAATPTIKHNKSSSDYFIETASSRTILSS